MDPRRTSPRRQLILWLVLMTVLYNSGFVHRDHHRLRDQLRDLRRNTCWTAALFRRLRVYTRRHAFHFSTIVSILAAPYGNVFSSICPNCNQSRRWHTEGDTDRCPKVGHCCSVPSPARVLWETMADHTLPCRTSAVHIGNGSWALYKANHICGLDCFGAGRHMVSGTFGDAKARWEARIGRLGFRARGRDVWKS